MRIASAFIASFLLVQVALPLDYYLRREDAADERFAWRMFSPLRSRICAPVFWVREEGGAGGPEGERSVALEARFHPAWIQTARRGRLRVTEAMGRSLCEPASDDAPGVRSVRAALSCTDLDGSRRRWSAPDLCRPGARLR